MSWNLWAYYNRDGWRPWRSPLHLLGEIDCTSVVDEICPATPAEQVEYWRDHIRRSYPEWWDSDAVPVSWFVDGGTVFESSPDCPTIARWRAAGDSTTETFSDVYTRPRWVGHDGRPIGLLRSWGDLPRSYDGFAGFSRAYGFVPAHTAYVPVRTWHPWADDPRSAGPSVPCLRCGRPLSDPVSVGAGHGPWCARKALAGAHSG